MTHQRRFPTCAHILVVEDDSLVRMIVVEMLQDAGVAVSEASHADAAWVILRERQESIRVLFADIDMPGSMDGFVLAGRVADAWPHIGLVVTSGRRPLADRELPDAGRFLRKPYHSADLMRAIMERI